MRRLVLLPIVVALLFSCGPQAAGEMRRESEVVDLEHARSVTVDLRMGAGELGATGGADALMEADFAYNVAEWSPEVTYEVNGVEGNLTVEQGSGEGISVGGDTRNEWDLRLNDAVPMDLSVELGAGESDLDLDGLSLVSLDLAMGAGRTTLNLTGQYGRDVTATIEGGVGEATVLLPRETGVRVNAGGGLGQINAEGLQRDGEAYVNDAYGEVGDVLEVDIRGGVGEINLEVV